MDIFPNTIVSFMYNKKMFELNKKKNKGCFLIILWPSLCLYWNGCNLGFDLEFLLWQFRFEWHFHKRG
ncbi:MAG: hypothetical protein GY853_06605 [PVC group bacterium]|nr:hypothetical protein [PVC group bacterium]